MESNHPSRASARTSFSILAGLAGSPTRKETWTATAPGAICRNPVKRNSSTTGALPVFHEPGYVAAFGGRVCGNAGVEDARSAQIHVVAISQRTSIPPCTEEDDYECKDDGLCCGVVCREA